MANSVSKKVKYLYLGLAVLIGLLIVASLTKQTLEPSIYFLDVGQGDSELIVLENNIKILIDGGVPGSAKQALAEVLPATDRYIDLVIMTHPELDHMGGLIDVAKNYQIGALISNGRKGPSSEYQELVKIIKEKNIPYITLHEGSVIKVGRASLKILSPSKTEILSSALNYTSLVTLLTTPDYKALFTADTGFNVEDRLIKSYDLTADILKIGHHGSKYSTSKEFLDAVSPQVAIIEVGKNNYGHPARETLNRIKQFTTQIYETLRAGTIKIQGNRQDLIIFRLSGSKY